MPGVINNRMVLDPLAKLLSYSLQNCTNINFPQLVSLCHYCNRCFIKERDKQLLTRTAVIELVQALKFKTAIPDANFLMLTNLVLLDAGGAIAIGTEYADSFPKLEFETVLGGGSTSGGPGSSPGGGSIAPGSSISTTNTPLYTTAASEVMRAHMADVLEFLSDVHTLSKVKSSVKANAAAAKPGGGGGSGTGAAAGASSGTGAASSGAVGVGLNEDTLGGILKASLSQYLALEIAKGNGKDSRTVNRYLPWLFNPPGNTATQGPREFLDCVAHIRLLSWMLLGAVNHTLKFGYSDSVACMPIPLEASCHIADHVQVILAGFAEQSKTSVVHMCSLFHAFILCQLWTVYLEQTIALLPAKDEQQVLASSILLDFWGKVTPGVLQLVSHSKVLAEMVNLHFLSLMEALMECHSTILVKLMPLWTPVLFAYQTQLPDHVHVRLQAIADMKPHELTTAGAPTAAAMESSATAAQGTSASLAPSATAGWAGSNAGVLVKWLQRLQFKMGQIEMQASNVTQFFTV